MAGHFTRKEAERALRERTPRFAKALVKAVEVVNALDPQPDFVLYGGDLAQLGRADELALGQQILKDRKAPVKMMVGEHDWFLDMGAKWREMFGPDRYILSKRAGVKLEAGKH
jgi:3',5'-cyclic AMP phosphodiesterase CpdA